MVKMFWLISIAHLLVCSTAKAGQESADLIRLHDPTVSTLQGVGQPVAVQVQTEHLKNISNSVLTAETWLRSYVLPLYPSTNVTTILVGHTVLCDENLHRKLGFISPAVKNIHYSLTRWGLQNDIKVTTSFSSDCLNPDPETCHYRADLAENHIKPLLTILQEIGSPYVVNPPPTPYSHALSSFLEKTHHESMKNLGVFGMSKFKFISSPRTENPTSRKLSSIDIAPFPFPAATGSPLPPLIGTISPALPPVASPPQFGPYLPPCEPPGGAVGGAHQHHGLWCVAKPSVPSETLQEALDFACGEGGADCEAIGQDGSCYYPDTVIAHASYAFNSYWQRNKKTGGTCGFGGTAMLINSDPSYNHCRFTLA